MRLALLAPLIATVAATPFLVERQATCAALASTTTTVGGATVTLSGPFKLQVSIPATQTAGAALNGNYARVFPPGDSAPAHYPFIVYGIKSTAPKRATNFYLDSNRHLVTILTNPATSQQALYYSNENPVSATTGHVSVSLNSKVANQPVCTYDTTTCALSCTVSTSTASYSYSCLASPKFQPDWRIAGAVEANHSGSCPGFTPIVVAA